MRKEKSGKRKEDSEKRVRGKSHILHAPPLITWASWSSTLSQGQVKKKKTQEEKKIFCGEVQKKKYTNNNMKEKKTSYKL